ncbi:MAG: 2'-deoxycytidine 5'-triphosphate deaminase, partial [Pseudomonadota bacterium]
MTTSGTGTPGVIPSQGLRALIAGGAIAAEPAVLPGQIQPASIDLRLGRRAWRVRASFLPGARRVEERLSEFAMHEIDLTDGAVLETGCAYVVELAESLRLAPDIAGAANAKSSTGRLDLLTRLVTDQSTAFDVVEAGY